MLLKTLVWGLLINLVLIAPLWLRFGIPDGGWVAWEAWLLVALFAALPNRAVFRLLRWLTAVLVLIAAVFAYSDAATHLVLSRPLNAYFDLILISASFNLFDGNLGRGGALAVVAITVFTLAAVLLLLGLALRPGRLQSKPGRAVALGAAAACLVLVVLERNDVRVVPAARTPAWDALSFQVEQIWTTHGERREFEAAAPSQPPPATVLEALADRNVLLVFIESYGISALDQSRYSDVVMPVFEQMAPALDEAGLGVVSGLMDAPVRGGQSWLAHATALSGRWIDNQLWYRMMLDSHRNTLIDDFRETGHETMAVVPAITMPWPEGRQLGYDQIFPAHAMVYAGPPLNWVTMPDQYTLHHFETVLRPAAREPLFAKIALISSHAPWTPVIDVLPDWDSIGDGRVFERWRGAGIPPQLLWQDMEKVREHYADSVAYSLEVSLDYAAHFLGPDDLLILLGDHQPAALITGHKAGPEVPVHVIAADDDLLEPFRQRGFVDGLVPDKTRESPGMDHLRDWLAEDSGGTNFGGN